MGDGLLVSLWRDATSEWSSFLFSLETEILLFYLIYWMICLNFSLFLFLDLSTSVYYQVSHLARITMAKGRISKVKGKYSVHELLGHVYGTFFPFSIYLVSAFLCFSFRHASSVGYLYIESRREI